jgi:hypothetical protein
MTTIINLWKLHHSALTNNIIVLLFVFGITPLAILFLVFQHVFISQQQANIATFQRDSAMWLAENFSVYVDKSYDQVKTLGEILGGEGSVQVIEKAKEFLAYHASFEQIAILDLQGYETAKMERNYTYPSAELHNRSTDSFIQKALEAHNSAIALDLQPADSAPTVKYISPIKDSAGQLVGWLEATVNLDFFWKLTSKARLNGNHSVFVIDLQNRRLLAKTFSMSLSPKDLERLPILRALADGTTGVWEYQSFQDQKVYRCLYQNPRHRLGCHR